MSIKAKYYSVYIIASLAYIIGTLLGPLTPNRFNLTAVKTHEIQFAIAIPVIFIWGLAVYGVVRLRRYTQKIVKDADGKALDKVAIGLSVLVFSYMINGLFGVLRAWAFRDGWLPAHTIIANYISVALSLLAFGYMFRGSLGLRRITRTKTKPIISTATAGIVLMVIAITYVLVLLNYNYLSSTPDPSRYSSLYLPRWLALVTIVIPYLISWGFGIFACINIATYQRHVQGVIYRSMIFRLVSGIFVVVVFTILLQLLVAFSAFFAHAGLSSLIVIIYLLLLLYTVGYLIIASGTRKLIKIEKVK